VEGAEEHVESIMKVCNRPVECVCSGMCVVECAEGVDVKEGPECVGRGWCGSVRRSVCGRRS
jgi:ABC-type transporter Mla maintaining outer membrane lipid asymmetry permease subunit MlaE